MKSLQNNTTMKSLADRLGLSKGTVSKALNDSHEISIATKNKVIEAANELHFMPNHFASGLKSRRSKTIAVIVPEIVDSFFSLAINGIETFTRKNGYHINIYISHDLLSKEIEIINALCDGRVDGVLISICREASDNAHIKELIDHGIPLVFFDRVADELKAGKVITDDFEGGYIAAGHLIEQGCKNVCFLSVSSCLSIVRKRMEGFIRALSEKNLAHPEKNVYQIPIEGIENLEAIKFLLSNEDGRPDGIVIAVELLTIPIYNACRELNINIPDEVKIICFSNLLYASLLAPPLSTITQPAFEIGQRAASLICNSIDRFIDINNEEIICPSRLDVRKSSQRMVLG